MSNAHVHVDVIREDNMRAGREDLQERNRSAHARCENQCIFATLEETHSFLEAVLRGIFVAHVNISMQLFARRAMFERR